MCLKINYCKMCREIPYIKIIISPTQFTGFNLQAK